MLPLRLRLVAYLREASDERRRRAVEQPHNPGHQRSAEALAAWADYVERLSDGDPHLRRIEAGQAEIGSPERFTPRSDGGVFIRSYGYGRFAMTLDEGGETAWVSEPGPEAPPDAHIMAELAHLEGPHDEGDEATLV